MLDLKIQILIAHNTKKQFALSMALQNQYERASNETSRRVLTLFFPGKDILFITLIVYHVTKPGEHRVNQHCVLNCYMNMVFEQPLYKKVFPPFVENKDAYIIQVFVKKSILFSKKNPSW